MSIEVCAASAGDVEQAIALLDIVWPFQNNRAMLTEVPNYEPHQTRVGILDGRVVTVAQVLNREMWVGGAVARLAYVGNVATHPEYRRRGYASAVLQDVIGYMEAHDYDLSMLHAAAPDLYSRCGWKIIHGRMVSFEFPLRPLQHLSKRYVARQGDWNSDLEAVAEIYEEYNRCRTGACRRSLEFWRASRKWKTDEDDRRFLVAEHRGVIVAYTRGSKDGHVILEMAYRRGHGDAVAHLFAALQKITGQGRVTAFLPDDPVFDGYLSNHAQRLSYHPHDAREMEPAMFRPLRMRDLAPLQGFCFYPADSF